MTLNWLCVNASMNSCVILCVSTATDWWPTQGMQHLSPCDSWGWLQPTYDPELAGTTTRSTTGYFTCSYFESPFTISKHGLFLSPVFLLGSSLGHRCQTHFHHLGLQLVMVLLYLLWSGGSLEQEPEAGWEVRTLVTCNSALLNQQLIDLLGHQRLLCGSWMLFYTYLHRVICGLTHCYILKLRTI